MIDLERAAVLAEAPPEEPIASLWPAPDGSALYVIGPRRDACGGRWNAPYVLRRLDPTTLAVAAERQFAAYRSLFFLAAPAS